MQFNACHKANCSSPLPVGYHDVLRHDDLHHVGVFQPVARLDAPLDLGDLLAAGGPLPEEEEAALLDVPLDLGDLLAAGGPLSRLTNVDSLIHFCFVRFL